MKEDIIKYKTTLKLLGRNIKTLRTEKRLTQKEVAKLLGISTNYISKIENGNVFFSTSLLVEISILFKVQPKDLFK